MQTAVKTNWKISFDEAVDFFRYSGKFTYRKGKRAFRVLCPIHDDRNPSMDVIEKEDGTAQFKCYNPDCCGDEEASKQFMKKMRKLFRGENVTRLPRIKKQTVDIKLLPLSLQELADEKGIPFDDLRKFGLYQGVWSDPTKEGVTQCVMIPSFTTDGEMYSKKQARMLQEITNEDGKTEIKKSIKRKGNGDLIPYGLHRLKEAKETGHLFLVEGESDCWTLWIHDFHALGIPGSGNTKFLKAEHVEGIHSIYILNEKDQAAKKFIRGIKEKLQEFEWEGKIHIITMPDGYKDPNELHLQLKDTSQFIMKMSELIAEAPTFEAWNEMEQAKEEVAPTSNVVSMEEKRQEKQQVDWMNQLNVTAKGILKNTVSNLDLIIKNDENLKNKFAYNQFTYKEEVTGDVPWARQVEGSSDMTDADDAGLKIYLSRQYEIESGNAAIHSVLKQNVLQHKYHPVRDFLSSLVWDGIPRLDTLLIDFMDAEDTELNRMQTRLTFVGAVKRIFQPGCKFDYVLTLKGGQGLGKSSFFQKLAYNNDWFTDQVDDLNNGKDTKEKIQGKWIVELGEMAAVGKGDQKRIKQFITSQRDEFRQSYDRRTSSFPRQCIFVASTNDDEPLKDDTGNRRWWMVEVKERWFDKDKPLEVNQIWAEAVHQYKKMEQEGIPLSLPKHLEEEAKKIQLENTDQGVFAAEIEYVLNEKGYYVDVINAGEKVFVNETCAIHIWDKVLNRYRSDYNTAVAREINSILKNLKGWKREGRRQFQEYGKQTVFVRDI